MTFTLRWIILPLFIWLTACAPQSNESTTDSSNITPIYKVDVYNQDDRLEARYELPEPQSDLIFSDRDTQQRNVAWKVTDDAFEFDGRKLRRKDGIPFQTATFDLIRDSRFFDRRYVVIDDIGPKAWSLYLPAFAVEGQDTELRFQSKDSLVARIGASPHVLGKPYKIGEENMMSYFGPPDYVRGEDAVIIVGPDIPNWLIDNVSAQVTQTMKVLESGFKVPPADTPTLYLTTGPHPSGRSSKGGQLNEAVMTFRYRGFDFSMVDQSLIDQISNTSAHEAAHLWIGGVYANIRNEEEPWMSEGGTEYIADRARNTSGDIKAEFEQRLNNCLKRLGSRPLNGSKGAVHGQAVYDCGYVLHGAAENAALKKSNANILDIWRHMIAALPAADKSYKPTDFQAAITDLGGPNFESFSSLFLKGGADTRWQDLPGFAQKIGIDLRPSLDNQMADTQLLTGLWLMPLLAENCEGSHGFYNNDYAKVLDGNKCKPPFKSGLELISVNEISLLTDAYLASNKARDICSEKGQLILGLKDGTKLPAIRCDLKIPPLPPYFKVTRFAALPPLVID